MTGVAELLAQALQPGDLLLTLGAGDGYRVGEMVLRIVKERRAPQIQETAAILTNG